MKRAVDRFGGLEVLRVVEEDTPLPGAGQVCVKVLAAGVPFTDQLIWAGAYLEGETAVYTRLRAGWCR